MGSLDLETYRLQQQGVADSELSEETLRFREQWRKELAEDSAGADENTPTEHVLRLYQRSPRNRNYWAIIHARMLPQLTELLDGDDALARATLDLARRCAPAAGKVEVIDWLLDLSEDAVEVVEVVEEPTDVEDVL